MIVPRRAPVGKWSYVIGFLVGVVMARLASLSGLVGSDMLGLASPAAGRSSAVVSSSAAVGNTVTTPPADTSEEPADTSEEECLPYISGTVQRNILETDTNGTAPRRRAKRVQRRPDLSLELIQRIPDLSETALCLRKPKESTFVKLMGRVVVGLPRGGRCAPKSCPLDQILPYNESLREEGHDWPPFGYTMVGKRRLLNVGAAIADVERNNIEGAIVELGVWRGGAMVYAAAVTSEHPNPRDIHLYDAFETLRNQTHMYKGGLNSFLATDEAEVRKAFDDFGVARPNIYFHQGLFKDTVPKWDPSDPIAVLRVDANMYDSHQDVMYSMYESVPVGGIIIFDDVMSHPEVIRFWEDWKKDQGTPEEWVRIDRHCAWFRKVKDVKLDRTKMHPPQDVNKVR